eukprot:4327803-Amphidinium_carterae.1
MSNGLVAPHPELGICGQPSPASAVYILLKMRAADKHNSAYIVNKHDAAYPIVSLGIQRCLDGLKICYAGNKTRFYMSLLQGTFNGHLSRRMMVINHAAICAFKNHSIH